MGLSLTLLGGLTIRDASGRSVSLPTRKTRALLAYLVANADEAQPRERLAWLLWSDRSEQQARRSLSQALMAIRKLDAGALLEGGGEQVTLCSDAIQSDFQRFRSLLRDRPAEAAVLYGGPFLDGFSVPDPAFEAWQLAMRSELQALACAALQRAADYAATSGEMNRAIDHVRRLVALDPLREEAHRCLMQLLHQTGDRAGALRQYQSCADILKRELQVEPDATTQATFEKIKRGSTVPKELEPELSQSGALSPSPSKPSIAVLPFVKLSDNPEEDLFAEGMAEDVITGLSRIRWLMVIARSSTFAYKGKSPDVRQVGKDLGVRYILEGSIRKHVDRLRVTAQLVDATTGMHVWADSYDRRLVDIFEIQDEITDAIVGALVPQIDRTERIRATERIRERRIPPENLDAWTQYQQALIAYHTGTLESLNEAIAFFDRAADIDPSFATAYAMGGACRNRLVINHGVEDSKAILEEAGRRLSTAVALDPQDATCRCIYGVWLALNDQYDLALDSLAKAIELSPSSAEAYFFNANVMRRAGRFEEAIASVDRAIRLSPNDARIGGFYLVRTGSLFDLAKYEECAIWARRAVHGPNPRSLSFIMLASALYYLDRKDEAETVLEELRATFPKFDFASFLRTRRGHSAESLERYVTALRALGFSE